MQSSPKTQQPLLFHMAFKISYLCRLKPPSVRRCFGLSDITGLETQFRYPNESGILRGDYGRGTALQIFLKCWYESSVMSASALWLFSLHAQNKLARKDTAGHFTQQSSAPKARSLDRSFYFCLLQSKQECYLVLNSPTS